MTDFCTRYEVVLIPYDDDTIGLQAFTFAIHDIFDYGRAVTRGLLVHKDKVWIVSRRRDGCWYLETKVEDVVEHQRGSNFVKWRNYLQRIHRWPWSAEDVQEIMGTQEIYQLEETE